MAFADFDWATDTNYPAGSATWSATPTKVAPSAGVQADGFTPEDRPPAQWINWLFNGIVTAGQALETFLGDGTIQWAFDNSVAEADLAIPTVQSALVAAPTTGAVSLLELSDGLWTPVVKAVSGTSVDIADFTSLTGVWSRVGEIVTFSLRGTINSTSWSGTSTFTIDMPVAGTLTRLYAAMTTTQACEDTEVEAAGGSYDAIFTINGATGPLGVGRKFTAVGQYRLA